MAKKKNEMRAVLRVAPVGQMKAYLVLEQELDALGRGALGSIHLNLALALLPVSVAFLLTLLSTEIKNLVVMVSFVVGSIGCFLAGLICAALAYHHHTGTSRLVEQIKARMPPPEDTQPAPPPPDAPSGPLPQAP